MGIWYEASTEPSSNEDGKGVSSAHILSTLGNKAMTAIKISAEMKQRGRGFKDSNISAMLNGTLVPHRLVEHSDAQPTPHTLYKATPLGRAILEVFAPLRIFKTANHHIRVITSETSETAWDIIDPKLERKRDGNVAARIRSVAPMSPNKWMTVGEWLALVNSQFEEPSEFKAISSALLSSSNGKQACPAIPHLKRERRPRGKGSQHAFMYSPPGVALVPQPVAPAEPEPVDQASDEQLPPSVKKALDESGIRLVPTDDNGTRKPLSLKGYCLRHADRLYNVLNRLHGTKLEAALEIIAANYRFASLCNDEEEE
jgi:DNA-binding HxlR family transcriptional regulator